jgi:hypothetical protein
MSEGVHTQEYAFPIKFDEKTDLEFRVIGDSAGANIAISAGMDLVYIKNDGAT